MNTARSKVTSAGVAAGLDDEHAEDSPVVLFDFDGVLLHGDAFHLFLRQRYARAPWRVLLALLCLPVLLAVALVSRMVAGHLLGRIALLGVRERRFQKLTSAFAAQLVRRSRVPTTSARVPTA